MFQQRKPHVYLKTYIYSSHEIKFLKLNVRESFDYVDRVIVCEYNRTHVGTPKDFIFEQSWSEFSNDEKKKIIYLPCDISDLVVSQNNSDGIHENENLMRGYFASQVELKSDDIVVSVDADEVIFGHFYHPLLKEISLFNQAIQLKLNQFFYKVNYLWVNQTFVAPTIARASYYKNKYPGQWRYDGRLYPEVVGSHFSWCMSVDEMLNKLRVYGHHYDYGHLGKREVLEQAVKNKTYPFDPMRDFQIRVLNMDVEREYLPEKIYSMLDEFKDLIV